MQQLAQGVIISYDGLVATPGQSKRGSPVMYGFQSITPSTIKRRGRGQGLKDARIRRIFDALQPEPLYQDFI